MMTVSNLFECQSCGYCCKKFICLYPSEIQKAKIHAQNLGIEIQFESFRTVLDFKNKKKIVLIYIMKHNPCPFLSNNKCLIYEDRFIACRKYPITSWIELGKIFAFLGLKHEFYDVDLNCGFFKRNPRFKEQLKNRPLFDIFQGEYKAAIQDKKNWLDLQDHLRYLKKIKRIKIICQTSIKDNNSHVIQEKTNLWEEISANDFFKNMIDPY